jgi:hypothetical protein
MKSEVPEVAAQLALGDRLQPDGLLARDHGAECIILGGAQRCGIDLAAAELFADAPQGGRAQQAPHVIGTERRFHGLGSLMSCMRTIPKRDAVRGSS